MIVMSRRLKDNLPELVQMAGWALERADLVVVTGGASVGEKDFAKAMFEPAGLELIFSKVAIKPGKPVWLGRAGGRLVMGLPGNPSSAMVTARLLLAPADRGAGRAGRLPCAGAGRCWPAPLGPCGDRETFVRAVWEGDAVRPAAYQDSGRAEDARGRRAADPPPRRRAGGGGRRDGRDHRLLISSLRGAERRGNPASLVMPRWIASLGSQ